MNINISLYIGAASLLLSIALIVWLALLEFRLKKLFSGKKAEDLEDVLASLTEDLRNLNISREKIETYLKETEERLRKSLKQVGFIRFNAFGEMGSSQSFSLAFLDEQGKGAVISALYSREGIRIYAKPIQNYKSEQALTPEEKEAIIKTRSL